MISDKRVRKTLFACWHCWMEKILQIPKVLVAALKEISSLSFSFFSPPHLHHISPPTTYISFSFFVILLLCKQINVWIKSRNCVGHFVLFMQYVVKCTMSWFKHSIVYLESFCVENLDIRLFLTLICKTKEYGLNQETKRFMKLQITVDKFNFKSDQGQYISMWAD